MFIAMGRFVRCCVEEMDSSQLEECERSVSLAYHHLLLAGPKPTQWHGAFAEAEGRPARCSRGTRFQVGFGVECVGCTYIEGSSKGFEPR